MTDSKTFKMEIPRADGNKVQVSAVGFPPGQAGSGFVTLYFGREHEGRFCIIVSPEAAREIADAFQSAADHAEPRVACEADLGIAA